MLKITVIDSGETCGRQRRVARVARRAAAVVRSTVHRRLICAEFAFAASVLLGHLGHVPLQRGELVGGRLHRVRLGT